MTTNRDQLATLLQGALERDAEQAPQLPPHWTGANQHITPIYNRSNDEATASLCSPIQLARKSVRGHVKVLAGGQEKSSRW